MRTELGKIKAVKMGIGGYQDAQFGIHFTLGGDSWGVTDSWSTWAPGLIDPSEYAKWTEENRAKHLAEICTRVSKLLQESKVTDVNQLVGKPIEVTFDGNMLKGWRILTEVL